MLVIVWSFISEYLLFVEWRVVIWRRRLVVHSGYVKCWLVEG